MNYRGGMWEGRGGQDGVKGGKWDNCNSIINILKKIKIHSKAVLSSVVASNLWVLISIRM